mmetsp:Transcript_22581/g.57073  ORF Transcript_22581/g.57073 Transcript_22581/m.57073 type:complete len:85 (-) Transcript_22581:190-444(-)
MWGGPGIALVRGARTSSLNELTTGATPGFTAWDGQPSVNAYSTDGGATTIYGPPGYEPMYWGVPGNSRVPVVANLPSDYVETFQ